MLPDSRSKTDRKNNFFFLIKEKQKSYRNVLTNIKEIQRKKLANDLANFFKLLFV